MTGDVLVTVKVGDLNYTVPAGGAAEAYMRKLAEDATRCHNCGELSKFPPPAPICADCEAEENGTGIYSEDPA